MDTCTRHDILCMYVHTGTYMNGAMQSLFFFTWYPSSVLHLFFLAALFPSLSQRRWRCRRTTCPGTDNHLLRLTFSLCCRLLQWASWCWIPSWVLSVSLTKRHDPSSSVGGLGVVAWDRAAHLLCCLIYFFSLLFCDRFWNWQNSRRHRTPNCPSPWVHNSIGGSDFRVLVYRYIRGYTAVS